MEKRKLMALASSAAMVMASMGIAPAVMADEVEKPEKITVMFDGTVFTQENGQAEFEARWEELTGIDLQIIQPDHSQYYDVLGQTIAGGDWPDVVLLGSTYYASYAAEGVLWDMTEAYDNSELKERITDQSVIDGLKIDGSLYGISPARGNGCITYVKKAWLDNCGLEVPTTYDEYLAMLEAFTTGDPDGNGVDGDTYGVSSAGLIGTEAPYTNYLPEFYQEIIQDELNVKKVEFTDDVRAFTSYSFKPQLRTVGRKYGKYVNEIKEILAGLDGNQAMDTLNETDLLSFETQDGTKVELAKEDLLIDMAQVPGFVSEGDNFVTVVLDTNLTPELIEEGFVREIISKIQTMRKEAGFEVMNHINVFQDGNDKLAEILKKHTEEIKKEVLADNILIGTMSGYTKEWDINGEKGMFGVEKTTD